MGFRLKPVVQVRVECDGLKTISVHEETYYRIRQYGKFNDTYEDILNKLCDVVDGKRSRASVVITDGATRSYPS